MPIASGGTVLAQVLLNGLTAGGVYALIALGFVTVYKSTGVMNFAQGQLVMLGAYFAVSFHQLGLSYMAAFVLAMASNAVLGLVLERVCCRPLLHAGEPAMIMATVATGILLENLVRLIWGPEFYSLRGPFDLTPVGLGPIRLSRQDLWILLVVLALFAGFYVFFQMTRWGMAVRAVGISHTSSALMGIDVNRVFSLTWAINAGLGAGAGMLLAPLLSVTPGMGNVVATTAFAAAVLGGIENLSGAVVGGLAIGMLENLLGFYVSTALKPLLVFAVMIGIVTVRPAGILGRSVAERA